LAYPPTGSRPGAERPINKEDGGRVVVTVMVTGGAGFIGSNLLRRLNANRERVRVLDDLSTGSLANLEDAGVDMTIGDIRDPDAVREAVAGTDVVYHLAALPSVARSVADPMKSHQVNVTGTMTVLQAARDAGVRRVVYASSSSVYGDTPTLPKEEGMSPQPQSPYAASKLAGEAYCRAFSRVYGVETVSLRFFNVFGPRQDPASEYAAVIPRFVTQMLAGDRPTVFGDGTQSRDFTYVDNAVRACILAGEAGPEAAGEVVNIACGQRITLLDLVGELNRLLGTDLEPSFGDPRPGDVRHSLAAIDRADRLIGYRPEMDVRRGLEDTVAWFAERPPVASGVRS
jgi:nucleoside-diphosphate-sugar epimerase